MKKPTFKEELSERQHSEFTVPSAVDREHILQSAKQAVKNGMNPNRAADAYGVDVAQLTK